MTRPRLLLVLLVALALAGTLAVFLGLPALLRRLPASRLGLPHRECRLGPERHAQASSRLGTRLEWFGVATVGFLLGVLQLAFETNLRPDPRLDGGRMWALRGIDLAGTPVWLVRLLRGFRVPAAHGRQAPRARS